MLLVVLPILKFEDRFEASGFDLAILQRLRALSGLERWESAAGAAGES
jgi:hypothetical protein